MGRIVIHTRKKKARGKKSSLSQEEYQSVIHAFGMLSSVGGASQRRISEAIAHNRNTMYYDVNKEPPRTWFKYIPTNFNADVPNISTSNPQASRKKSLNAPVPKAVDDREWETLK